MDGFFIINVGTMMFILIVFMLGSIRVLKEYERGVIFRLGRVIRTVGPGLVIVLFPIDKMVKVSLRVTCFEIPSQDVISIDNVTVKVDAVVCCRVVEPRQAIIEVNDYQQPVAMLSTTTLKTMLPRKTIYELLYERETINTDIQAVINEHIKPWGIQVTAVEIKDVNIPIEMRSTVNKLVESRHSRSK